MQQMAPKRITTNSLRVQLKELGFPTDGEKEDLIKRLEEAKNADIQPISPASSEDIVENVDALVHTTCKLADDATMVAEAEQNVINEVNAGLITEAISDHIVVGNPRGSNIFSELARLRADRDADRDADRALNEADRAQNKAFWEKLQLQQEGLASQMKELAAVTSGFRSVRERFLENYRRDKMKSTVADNRKVKEGNEVAHGGNVLSDAKIFLDTNRRDMSTFESLYGLTPLVAHRLCKVLSLSFVG
jgi:hypothetical protein